EARAVLPNSLKTEIVMTANLREWRHVLGLRSSKAAHPQIRQIMLPLLGDLGQRLPEFFADLAEKYAEDIAAFAKGPAALGGPEAG
ncbi:MAG: FAD-dependent thymidylate synthase, partial [Proteobacteria bacterium]|nr:FAD-dependent thymidylate synthase [Pseudomonadota bacterium]